MCLCNFSCSTTSVSPLISFWNKSLTSPLQWNGKRNSVSGRGNFPPPPIFSHQIREADGRPRRRLPSLQRHRPITDLKLITRDGPRTRTDVRTDPPSVLLGAVAVPGTGRLARREHFLRDYIPLSLLPLLYLNRSNCSYHRVPLMRLSSDKEGLTSKCHAAPRRRCSLSSRPSLFPPSLYPYLLCGP